MVLAVLLGLTAGDLLYGATFVVGPNGNDENPGTAERPFQTLAQSQVAVRPLLEKMQSDVVVHVAPGDYRLEQPLKFTEADSGRNGFRVVYRSDAGPGKARLLGSKILQGWQPYRDGIWKIDLPPKTAFHTLYENGKAPTKHGFRTTSIIRIFRRRGATW